jgi:hypothetical protein
MEHLKDGKARYRLDFGGNPTLNSHDFVSYRMYEVRDSFEIEASRKRWTVAAVLEAEDGVPDTLVIRKAD